MYGFDEEQSKAELGRAQGLITKAEQQAKEGNIKAALPQFMKAMQIMLDAGHYRKVADIFDLAVGFANKESLLLPIMNDLQQAMGTIEALDLPEEIARLKLALANISYKTGDYINAATTFAEAAELFFQVDADEFRNETGMLLLRAAECLEKAGKTERAQKLVLDAIRRFDVSNFDYAAHFRLLQGWIQKKKYNEATEVIREIARFFRHLWEDLFKLPEESPGFQNLKRNVEARLIHMFSEFNMIKMMLYRHLGNEEKVRDQAEKSLKDIKAAITLMKEDIKEGYFTSADLHRLTYDLLLLQVFQEFADYQVEDPRDLATRGLPKDVVAILTKMKFFESAMKVIAVNLKDQADALQQLPLSQILEPFREFIFKSIAM